MDRIGETASGESRAPVDPATSLGSSWADAAWGSARGLLGFRFRCRVQTCRSFSSLAVSLSWSVGRTTVAVDLRCAGPHRGASDGFRARYTGDSLSVNIYYPRRIQPPVRNVNTCDDSFSTKKDAG